MILYLNKCIFISKYALRCHYDQIEHLQLALDDLFRGRITATLLDEIIASSGSLFAFFLENLLQLCTVLLVVFVNDDDFLSDLELTIDDKKDTISSIALFIEHLITLKSALLQALYEILLCISGELTKKADLFDKFKFLVFCALFSIITGLFIFLFLELDQENAIPSRVYGTRPLHLLSDVV